VKFTVSSPLKVHGIPKVPARRAPDIGEHNEDVLKQLGFTIGEIDGLRASGTIPHARHLETETAGGDR
jgi:formyl-CoA transferase